MSTADEVHIVLLQEAGYHVRSKSKRHTTVILAPSGNVLVRVGPQEVAEETWASVQYNSVAAANMMCSPKRTRGLRVDSVAKATHQCREHPSGA